MFRPERHRGGRHTAALTLQEAALRIWFTIMHLWSLSELQGASTPQTAQDGASSWSSRLRGDSPLPSSPLRGACFWMCLLLGSLLVPGARSLSNTEEELLVELHNHYRGQVSPKASAMMPLKWDQNLKVLAEGYAAKCIWNHNPDLEDIGENLFAGTGPLDLPSALEKWFLEHLNYDYQNNSCEEDQMCGHYTQMVWADSHTVGCGFHLCNTMSGLNWENVSFLVCNYFPAGNYEDQRPYVEGDPCSSCPHNLQKCENNLCVPDMVDDGDITSSPSDPAPEGTHSSADVAFFDTSTNSPTVPSILTTDVTCCTKSPLPGTTTEQEYFSTDVHTLSSSGKPGEDGTKEEEEEQRRKRIIWNQEMWRKSVPKGRVSVGSVSNPAVLLACLTGRFFL
ncbi:peptidase inhibitor 16 [Cyprinodon tularosa]|uniref:peptidase inhibitor 16 n=1 Tax=Cyprinodon tularosa TaxID=77115 RepID=UPI0018E226C5|nr:peptidase inhibitor 16 [Cyprinodon tularosa]